MGSSHQGCWTWQMIDHPTRRQTQGAGIDKGWEAKQDHEHIPVTFTCNKNVTCHSPLSAACWGYLLIIIIHYSPCVLGFQNRPIVWSMRVIRGDRRVQVVRWGPLSLFLLFFLLFSVLFFSHTRISCLGWGGWFRLLPRSFFPFLFPNLLWGRQLPGLGSEVSPSVPPYLFSSLFLLPFPLFLVFFS